MAAEGFTIGVLARKAGVHVETIRYYQRRGLLTVPEKALRGVRRYGPKDAERLRFIREAQRHGFSLDDIAELLNLDDGVRCREAREIAARKLALIRERISALKQMAETLSLLVERCSRNEEEVACPVITTLLQAAGL